MMRDIVHKILETIYFFSNFSLRNKKIVLFGSWFGNQVGDNPMYLLNDILKKKSNNKYIWIGNENVKNQVTSKFKGQVQFCRRNSLKSFYYQLRAGYIFVNQGYLDIGSINLMKGGSIIQLWHGFPVKKIVDDMNNSEDRQSYQHYNYFLSTSSLMTNRICSAFRGWGATRQNIIECLQPRNEILLKQVDLILVKKELGISAGQRIVLYLPTFRDSGKESFNFHNLDLKEKKILKEKNVVIIQKTHFAENRSKLKSEDGIIDILPDFEYDTQILMKLADTLISDFSSAFVDFLILDRPIIHFVYDFKEYIQKDRGIYASDFKNEAGGEIVTTTVELVSSIIDCCSDKGTIRRHEVNDKLNEFRDKDPVKEIFKKVSGFQSNFFEN